jgi:hypothetical protein
VIGRFKPHVDYLIDDVNISRRHAIFQFDAERTLWTVMDNRSLNGIIINGNMITPEVPFSLSDGDEVSIGRNCGYEWVFRFPNIACNMNSHKNQMPIIKNETSFNNKNVASVKRLHILEEYENTQRIVNEKSKKRNTNLKGTIRNLMQEKENAISNSQCSVATCAIDYFENISSMEEENISTVEVNSLHEPRCLRKHSKTDDKNSIVLK